MENQEFCFQKSWLPCVWINLYIFKFNSFEFWNIRIKLWNIRKQNGALFLIYDINKIIQSIKIVIVSFFKLRIEFSLYRLYFCFLVLLV